MALPYRTGLWISQCDDTGGHDATAQELAALEQVVIAFGEDFCKSEFVEELMRQTLARRDRWQSWHADLGDIPGDARRAVDMLAPLLERKDIASLKQTLIEIAETVAKAYKEEEAPAFDLRHAVAVVMARLQNRPAPMRDALMNISRAERAALNALTASLRPQDVEGQPPATDDSAAA